MPLSPASHPSASLEEAGTASMVLFRLFAMFSIFAVKLLFGSAPLRFRTNFRFLSICNAFAAGVFLAGGLMHLLPEAVEAFRSIQSTEHADDEHNHHHHCETDGMPYLLCACGFLMTFYLEKVVLAPPAKDEDSAAPDSAATAADVEAGPAVKEAGHHGHSHGHAELFKQFGRGEQSIMPVVLTAVLSVHSVVSGLALGIQRDPSKAFLVYLAIISHKWVEAFSLGTNIVKSTGASVPVLIRLLLAFAVSSPLGIILGWGLQVGLAGGVASQVTAALDAMASGTFLYIAVIDTLAEEFSNGIDCHRKFVAVVTGFATMRFLGSLVAHHHD